MIQHSDSCPAPRDTAQSDPGGGLHTHFPSQFRIAICDDDANDRNRLRQEISSLAAMRPLQFAEFADGCSLLNSEESFDLIFLDIIMDGRNGIETARKMRRRNCHALIIFVTNSHEHLMSGYEVEAFRYLLKPYAASELRDILEKAFERLDKRGLVVRGAGSIWRLPFEQIRYMEAQGRRCRIFLTDGSELTVSQGISQMEKQVNQALLMRCQKSFIVNLEQIVRIRRYEAVLQDGTVIPIGRRLWSAVQDRFLSYLSLD